MEDIIGQVDEVEAKLKVGRLCRDAIAEVGAHQLAVLRGLGVIEHPVFTSLQRDEQKEQNQNQFESNTILYEC